MENRSASRPADPFGARTVFPLEDGTPAVAYRLGALEERGIAAVGRLPFSIKVLLEALLRQVDGYQVTEQDVRRLAAWDPHQVSDAEIPFKPARVLLQDFTGVPAVVDLAAMRAAMARMGGDPERINPLVPVDLVVDHSVQVDRFGSPDAFQFNVEREFERNQERYRLLHWAQNAFQRFRVIPPDTGIVHQVNLEYLATVVTRRQVGDEVQVFPDSVVGTDSHTPMVNGMGVLGWGIGGIEAEANMLGQPLYFVTPRVIGVRLSGRLPAGSTATDLALTVTQRLRAKGVVGQFVEFFGPGLESLSVADRATVANMAPEYGATVGYFPVDGETLRYLRLTGRSPEQVALVERYLRLQGLFRDAATPDPEFSEVVELDLATVEPSLAGPKRPQDRVALSQLAASFRKALTAPVAERGFGLDEAALDASAEVRYEDGVRETLRHGSVVIAAITSCTNTSNPSVMLAAGLLAKKANQLGLKPPRYVKTSLAPGSRVVTEYLRTSGLLPHLEALGFALVGYGCTTCIGNSGPLPEAVSRALEANDLTVAAVLSGNRNFEGRIHPLVRANYLASPPLVVAYALAGTVAKDLTQQPLALTADGRPVYLRDLWPTPQELEQVMAQALRPEAFREQYQRVFAANPLWDRLDAPRGTLYQWDPASTYIQEPPFFRDQGSAPAAAPAAIRGARLLALLGDSVTTDHISPAGSIAVDSPAGRYLQEHGVRPADFNSYGARRGNHEVMMRGTFANIRIRNALVPEREGGYTRHWPGGEVLPIYDAAMRYRQEGVPLVIMAGKEYGSGSSRDWAAKGTALLGVKAVIAESYERIHRSNLVGMGVLPLEFAPGRGWRQLGISGDEEIDILDLEGGLKPHGQVRVRCRKPAGEVVEFTATVRLDTPVEVDYYRNGGILPTVLRHLRALA